MKSFFNVFKSSFEELTGKNKLRCIAITAMLIALSMAIEKLTIPLPFGKINFAYIAIAAIGMLFGPVVSFFAGGMCDILGYLAYPDGAFLPIYTLIAMVQGLIYGLTLYCGWGKIVSPDSTNVRKISEFSIRIIVSRILDVLLINLICNTAANMYYGFIPQEAFITAVQVRTVKNLIQICIDIPIMLVWMPTILMVYRRTAHSRA